MARLAVATGVLAISTLVACSAPPPAPSELPTPLVAPPGEILIPECRDEAACADGFVVADPNYLLVCSGVDPAAVAEETLASGQGMFVETRGITDIPSEFWVAVRGDIPCEPLDHEWYLAMNGDGISPADLEEWGDAVGEATIP